MAKTYKQIFGLQRVRQIRPDSLFGSELIGLYTVLEKFMYKKYEASEIQNELSRVFHKQSKYWGQFISIHSTIGALRINEENTIVNIPVLEYANSEYNMGNQKPAEILLNYLLSEFQFPHPGLTSSKSETKTGQKLRYFKVVKPYISILSILNGLYENDRKECYLTHEEIYFIDKENESSEGEYLQINNTNKVIENILEQRGNKDYYSHEINTVVLKEIKNINGYLKGFLNNSVFLNFDKPSLEIPRGQFFCSLNFDIKNLFTEINSLINSSLSHYEFDPSISHNDRELKYYYSTYLLDENKINAFLTNLSTFDSNDFFISSGPNIKIQDFDKKKYDKYRVEYLLDKMESTDTTRRSKGRLEQQLLRKFYLYGKEHENCSICHDLFPITSLTIAHIKKRTHASDEERTDPNIVMPACYLGCDHLYEKGYLIAEDGKFKFNKKLDFEKYKLTDVIKSRIKIIDGNECINWENSRKYFESHRQLHQTN